MYLICHVTSHDHLFEGSCKFMDGSMQYDVTLISLVTISIATAEMFLICHVTSHEHMFKGAAKSNFMYYSCVVNILFNTDLYESAFSSNSFKKLVFCLSVVFCVFCPFCFQFDVIFKYFL